MKERETIWEDALVPGLVLGAIPAAATLLAELLELWQPAGTGPVLLKTAAAMLLWAAKLTCCIAAFRIFMTRFRDSRRPEGNGLFRFGAAIALLSAIIYSGFYLACNTYLFPENFERITDIMRGQAVSKMDAATRAAFEDMLPQLPKMLFFGNATYCFLFGTVLSAIFSSKLKN